MRTFGLWGLGAGAIALGLLATAQAGCGDDAPQGGPDDASAGDGTAGSDGDLPDGLVGGGCTTSRECDGGVCVNGVCCANAAQACGTQCCTGGSVCLFDKCVIPGDTCQSANDCKPGEYCEPALGTSKDAGASDAAAEASSDGGPACTQPVPIRGRCIPLPAKCPADAGPGDGGCVPNCEFRPSTTAKLDAVPKWSWGPVAKDFPDFTDVWSTPAVGRISDANCDGKVDELDPPNIVFVSGRSKDADSGAGTCCQCTGTTPTACLTGVLRMLDGRTGKEVWSKRRASAGSSGFAGVSVAVGDIDGDKRLDVLAVTGEGYVVMLDHAGNVVRTSDKPIPGRDDTVFGWGGGLAVADMDGDGAPEIAYGHTVFGTTGGAITLKWTGTGGVGGAMHTALSTFVDLDGAPDGNLELLAGRTAYRANGTILWNRADLPDGFVAVGDFEKNGSPEVVLVATGTVHLLKGLDGADVMPALALSGTGSGGPPTVADFDGDGRPEIGIAQQNFYSMVKPAFGATPALKTVWSTPNHDLSSSVTGSTVFDFEGDGRAEVIYNDECYLWVYDGKTGAVRFAGLTSSFTGTEASLVADVDGDGRAEIVMVSNNADPTQWKCNVAPWNQADPDAGRPAWKPPPGHPSYRGITVFGDRRNAWVGTRTLWNQHTYHVSNICDDRDTACAATDPYGSIPKREAKNWTVPWLDNFRQNVQDKGLFDAPDAVVALVVDCTAPLTARVSVRNAGLASLPPGVDVAILKKGTPDVQLGTAKTTRYLFPGQTEELVVALPASALGTDYFYARIVIDPKNPLFQQCRADNDRSADVQASCPK